MGMFDWVNVEIPCPKCGAMVRGFQSKDSHCNLANIEAEAVQRFYSSCRKCDTWIEYARDDPPYIPAGAKPATVEQVLAWGFKQILPDAGNGE